MNSGYGFFLPLESKFINIKIDFNLKRYSNLIGPFFQIENENSMVDFFLRTLFNSSIDEAKKFISPDIDEFLDLDEVKKYFDTDWICVSRGNFKQRHHFVNSVLFFNKATGSSDIIDFYLINQPDKFSRWKIYAIL